MPALGHRQRHAGHVEHPAGDVARTRLEASQVTIGAIQRGDICSLISSSALAHAEVLGHAGERGRGDGVDGDAVAGQLHGGDDREGGDAGLGRAVVGLADVAVDARRREVLMMRASTVSPRLDLLAPVGGGVAGRGEGALEVHLDDRVPLLLGHVDEHAVAQDAGVVDEHVEVAEGVDGLV